jgi:hypothetical protein
VETPWGRGLIHARPFGPDLKIRLFDRTPSLASQLPQVFCVAQDYGSTPERCRSEPARDGVGSDNEDIGWAGLIASRLTPTGFCVAQDYGSTPNGVGVSLLAMASVQPMRMLTGLASSRAGSRLQGAMLITGFVVNTVHCGSWLASDGGIAGAGDQSVSSTSWTRAQSSINRAGVPQTLRL